MDRHTQNCQFEISYCQKDWRNILQVQSGQLGELPLNLLENLWNKLSKGGVKFTWTYSIICPRLYLSRHL